MIDRVTSGEHDVDVHTQLGAPHTKSIAIGM
jgi:hypothetical protein